MSAHATEVLYFWLYLAALWFFWHVCWISYSVDRLRSELFDIRSRLFFYVADRDLSFQHQAYRILRNDINGMIRFAEKMILLRAVLFVRVAGVVSPPSWPDELKGLPLHVQRELLKLHQESINAVVRHVLRRSFFLLLIVNSLVYLVRLVTVGRQIVTHTRSWRNTIGQSLEAQAREEYRLAS